MNQSSNLFGACRPFLEDQVRRFGLFFMYYDIKKYKDGDAATESLFYRAFPLTVFIIGFDLLCCFVKGDRHSPRVNATVESAGVTMATVLTTVVLKSILFIFGNYINANLSFARMDPNSIWTWILACVLMDFSIYVVHRAMHEINILWAAHQIHHLPDQYNMTIGGRLSFIDPILLSMPTLIWCFFMPFEIVFIAVQCVTLFGLLNHRNFMMSFGPLDKLIMCPRTHRMHHGINRSCIDVNYANVLTLWDRAFGTFVDTKDEKLVLGLTAPLNTYNPFNSMINPFLGVLRKVVDSDTYVNMIKSVYYGPGWSDGKPRLGNKTDIAEVDFNNPPPVFNPKLSFGLKMYIGFNFAFITFIGFIVVHMGTLLQRISYESVATVYLFFGTFISFGMFFDKSSYAPYMDMIRCVLSGLFVYYFLIPYADMLPAGISSDILHQSYAVLIALYGVFLLYWIGHVIQRKETEGDKEVKVNDIECATKVESRQTAELVAWFIFSFVVVFIIFVIYASINNACGYSLSSVVGT